MSDVFFYPRPALPEKKSSLNVRGISVPDTENSFHYATFPKFPEKRLKPHCLGESKMLTINLCTVKLLAHDQHENAQHSIKASNSYGGNIAAPP